MKGAKFLIIAANEGARWGGSEILWSLAAERLVRGGNEVRVSVRDWGEPIPQIEHLRSAGCEIFHRRPPDLVARLARKILPLADYSRAHVRSAGSGVDLVVISQGANFDGLLWMEAVRSVGLRYVVLAQGAAEQWWPPDDDAERQAEGYESASASYFVSQANVSLSRRQFATPLRNAKVVQNPFNVGYDARPPWPSDASEGLSLACVARLDTAHKGQDILLQVLSLPHWRERKVRVSLVGKGIHERGLRRNAEHLGLTSVDFAGHLDDIEGVWSKHHALVLASRYEGMPLALVEAMLCGRAPIITDVASHAELVRDGVNGFLAKAPSVAFLDEAMNRAWEARQSLRAMGETAGRDIRKWVSKDPAKDFARELESLANRNDKR
jgi:glycosyltransferase involved in cell wall biosynthesis